MEKPTAADGIDARFPSQLADPSYDEVLERDLGVMDLTAICLCRDNGMPVRVFNMNKPGNLLRIVVGEEEGTLITGDRSQ